MNSAQKRCTYASNAWVIGSKVRGQVGLESCVIFVVTVDGSETLLPEQKRTCSVSNSKAATDLRCKHRLARLSVSGTVHARFCVRSIRCAVRTFKKCVCTAADYSCPSHEAESDKTPVVPCCCSISVQCQKPSVRLHVTKTGHQAEVFPLYDSVQSLIVILESIARVVPELVTRMRLCVHPLEHKKTFFLSHLGFVIGVTMCNNFVH